MKGGHDYRFGNIERKVRDEILEIIVGQHLKITESQKYKFFYHESPYLNKYHTSE